MDRSIIEFLKFRGYRKLPIADSSSIDLPYPGDADGGACKEELILL